LISIIQGSDEGARAAFTARKIEVLEEGVVHSGPHAQYVAVVANRSSKRVAVATFARGAVEERDGTVIARLPPRHRTLIRPTLPAGARGVVVAPLRVREPRTLDEVASYNVEVVARRAAPEFDRPIASLALHDVALDRRRCRVEGWVRFNGVLRNQPFEIVIRGADDRIVEADVATQRALRGPRDRIRFTARDPRECVHSWASAEVYPYVLPAQATGS
jgi:hypothetical protein